MITEVYNYNQCMTELEIKVWSYELFIDEHGFHNLTLTEYIRWQEYYEWRFNTPTPPPHCAPAG
jgi:hypothetical protein